MKRILKYLALAIVSLFFLIGGSGHFTSTDFFVSIVPPWVPMPREVVYFTGVIELAGAVAIWIPRLRKWAGIGLFVLTVAVTPANVHMWLNAELYPTVSETVLFWRLPAQVVLLALIWWSTRPDKHAAADARAEVLPSSGSSLTG